MRSSQWNRRTFLQAAALTAAAKGLHAAQVDMPGVVVRAPVGSVRGVSQGEANVFKGLPYGQPPVGDLRFRAPVPVTPWNGVKVATAFGPSAAQAGRKDTNEDCLYLNVYAPAAKGSYPVYMWIHGGGFTSGSPNEPMYDGTGFAKDGIVVVTVTYRLGVFGFLDWSPILGPSYATSANNALRDLMLALHWVQANISAFGGDPKRVTIGGESAGAKLVGLLMGIDEATPLFAQAISESGGAERIRDSATSTEVSHLFAEKLKTTQSIGPSDPLKALTPTLLATQQALISAWPASFPLRPQEGGTIFPQRAVVSIRKGSTRGKRLLLGTNRDESALFLGSHAAESLTQRNLSTVSYDRFAPVFQQYRKLHREMTPAQLNIRALSAEEYWVPSMRLAEAHADGGGSAYVYRLDEEAAEGQYKGEAYHSFDLGFVWQHLAASEPPPAQALSRQMHQAWAAFIKGGTPAAAGLPTWPHWNATSRSTMILKDRSEVQSQPAEDELKLWKEFAFD
jgi:para-nitrobenzyl esterase